MSPAKTRYDRDILTSNVLCRSVLSSSYGETGGSSNGAALTTIVNGTSGNSSRYASPTSSASIGTSSSTRERSNIDTTADIISRYSPAGYVPNIQRQQTVGSGGTHHWKYRSTSSSLSELVGGDEREVERRDFRPESSLSSSSSSSSAVVGGATGLLSSRSSKRRPPASSTVLTTVGHARANSAVSPSEVTTIIDDHINRKLKDDDNDDDTKDISSDDDQHNNNSNIGIGGRDGENIACGYGVNNNDDNDGDDDDDEDENDDVDVDNDDSNDDDDNINNHHHRFRQQRSCQPNEVSPKHNLSSAAGAAGGGGGLIDVNSLDLLTNPATNPRNTELLINNNTQNKVTRGAKEEEEEQELENATSNEVTHSADDISSIDVFLQGGRNRKISDNGEDDRNNVSASDDSDFDGGSPLIDSIAGRPSVTHGDDPSIPSTSRRGEQSGLFSTTASGNLTSSPTNVSTVHQSIYRGVNEQYVSALVKRIAYTLSERSIDHVQFSML